MEKQTFFAKLKKYPAAAAAAFVAAAVPLVFAMPSKAVLMPYLAIWLLSVLFTLHIWIKFEGEKTYRFSGIIPAWVLLGAAFALLFCGNMWRGLSLVFTFLAMCEYSAGVIIGMKLTLPMTLFLWVLPHFELLAGVFTRVLRHVASTLALKIVPAIGETPFQQDPAILFSYWQPVELVYPCIFFLLGFIIATITVKTSFQQFLLCCTSLPVVIAGLTFLDVLAFCRRSLGDMHAVIFLVLASLVVFNIFGRLIRGRRADEKKEGN